MDRDAKFTFAMDKLSFYKAEYRLGCNQILKGEFYFQAENYRKAAGKFAKAMQILGYAKALKEKISICEEKINGGTNEMGMSSLQEMDILESMEERRQGYYGEACEAFKCGNIESSQRSIKDMLITDPKFVPGRILKAEMKLVATFKRPWQQVITEKDLFLRSVSFLPPSEYWKARFEDTPQAGPSEQLKEDISNESEKEVWRKPRLYPTRDLTDIKLPDSDDDQKIVDLKEFRVLD